MAFRLVEKGIKEKIRNLLQKRIGDNLVAKKTLILGSSHVDIECHTGKIIPAIDQQLKFSLVESFDKIDGRIVVWEEHSGIEILKIICDYYASFQQRYRILNLYRRNGMVAHLSYFFCENQTDENPIEIELDLPSGHVEVYDGEKACCYCGFDNFLNKELVKHGHLFFRQIYFLSNTSKGSLVHGAVIGWDGNGILLCAKGKCGKSTLSIKSLLSGAEYVAEDYQILESDNRNLYAYPIYSVVTLGNDMYQQMRGEFKGDFYSLNWDESKSIYDISCYAGAVRTHYPIRFCLFPQFSQDVHPSIVKCGESEKGRAILHLIYSTLMQTGNLDKSEQIEKLFIMLRDMPFYKINLSKNIFENTVVLENFVRNNDFKNDKWSGNPRYLEDSTFGKTQILDLKEYCFYES